MNTEFLGTFKLSSSVNFDEYLAVLGASFIMRKLYRSYTPTLTISTSNNTITIEESSPAKTTSITFTIDVEFDETTLVDSQHKTTTTEKDDGLVQSRTSGTPSIITRRIEGNQLIETYFINEITATRIFERQA
ncbi:lipocalin/fatty-acid binding family protein [Pseudomonas sichuanensis]|uniref:lipocalin/fatty-acid binding family protein n=1 Tax=Pseudomonas sichuanensis TaxID=2213015 RepID=UPI00244B302E|nr:lipocalin/fatty-acid binding family protein [Pseudomonas sichuanensis]MDH0731888.1 lipocalin/fatty-acid binding family protein [Pseudomonas sichuanensis]MDH1584089.1 lipocalin/fatty-acid binding family protein [Pseudomonas sichuanensis]MDH1593032.1 lipocalin/fatty-acid binding family protein [Pseudomonas sichuanensis]MDH1598938.1 lipocalin/fatty-acid binding family protein [Pseudomonas sichuanensis]